MRPASAKIEQLESLRGIAALIVVLHHFVLAFAPQRHGALTDVAIPGGHLMESPLFFLFNGTASVSLFFVLSGFVLSLGYFQDPSKPIAGAVARRWPRLFPVALVATLLAWTLFQLDLLRHAEAARISHSEWLRLFGFAARQFSDDVGLLDAVVQGAFLVFFRSSADAWMNGSLWTMHLELVGSFLVFGLAAVMRGSAPRQAAVIIVTTAILAAFGNAYFPLFIAGTALAYVHSRRPVACVARPPLATLGCLMLLVVAFGYGEPGRGVYAFARVAGEHEAGLRVFVHGAASVALIHLAMANRAIHTVLDARPLRFLGRVSFPMYALHLPLLFSAGAAAFIGLTERYGYRVALAGALLATLALLLPASMALAAADRRWCALLRGRRDGPALPYAGIRPTQRDTP